MRFFFIYDVGRFKVKDALKILHLRLENAQLERRIKSKPFSGVDLTRLDLVERHA